MSFKKLEGYGKRYYNPSSDLLMCHPEEHSDEGSPPLKTVSNGGDPSSLRSSG